jgi:dihydrofolate reductase
MSKPIITIVAAVSDNNIIGDHNDLPWYIPEDLKHFKALTTGQTVLMGKKTFESVMKRLGKPLPNRKNIVVTRDQNDQFPEGVVVLHDLKGLLDLDEKEIMIIGGGQIYQQTISLADKMHLTHVHQVIKGDVLFPEVDWSKWKKVSEEKHEGFDFSDYEKIK